MYTQWNCRKVACVTSMWRSRTPSQDKRVPLLRTTGGLLLPVGKINLRHLKIPTCRRTNANECVASTRRQRATQISPLSDHARYNFWRYATPPLFLCFLHYLPTKRAARNLSGFALLSFSAHRTQPSFPFTYVTRSIVSRSHQVSVHFCTTYFIYPLARNKRMKG